jgi:hypothetical protein
MLSWRVREVRAVTSQDSQVWNLKPPEQGLAVSATSARSPATCSLSREHTGLSSRRGLLPVVPSERFSKTRVGGKGRGEEGDGAGWRTGYGGPGIARFRGQPPRFSSNVPTLKPFLVSKRMKLVFMERQGLGASALEPLFPCLESVARAGQ